MNTTKTAIPATNPADLEMRRRLGQVIFDIGALGERRRELVQAIADARAQFKIGDVIIGAKRKAMKITRVVGVEETYSEDERTPDVDVFYAGRLILKDGSLGKNTLDTRWDYTLGGGLRLAKPSEYSPPPTAKERARA